jgi:hypothetical protein
MMTITANGKLGSNLEAADLAAAAAVTAVWLCSTKQFKPCSHDKNCMKP